MFLLSVPLLFLRGRRRLSSTWSVQWYHSEAGFVKNYILPILRLTNVLNGQGEMKVLEFLWVCCSTNCVQRKVVLIWHILNLGLVILFLMHLEWCVGRMCKNTINRLFSLFLFLIGRRMENPLTGNAVLLYEGRCFTCPWSVYPRHVYLETWTYFRNCFDLDSEWC